MFPNVHGWIWIIGFLLLNTYINILGIELTAKVNKVFMWSQIVVIIWFLIAVAIAGASGTGGAKFSSYAFFRPDFFTGAVLFGAIAMATYNFIGVDALTTLAEETRGGYRTVGIGMTLAVLIIGLCFAFITYAGTVIYPDPTNIGNPDTALYIAAKIAGGPILHWVVVIVVAIAVGFGCSLCCQASVARVFFGMGRDRMLPHSFALVHHKYKTPWFGIIFAAVVNLILALGFAKHGELLFQFVCFGALLTFALVNLAALYYFTIKKGSKRIFFHVVCPLLGALGTGYAWIHLNRMALLIGFCWLAFGLIYFLYLKYLKKVDLTLEAVE